MPHVKIENSPDLDDLFRSLPTIDHRDDSGVQKVVTYFMEQNGEQILAEALVIDVGRPRRFFVSIKQRDGEVVVRCLQITDLEKTEGVKRLIARLGLAILALREGASLGNTNLADQIAAIRGKVS
ncbi:MAG: hypothetical protein GY835_06745 [bacterium]|nr:hypothetical protein [bacterium]